MNHRELRKMNPRDFRRTVIEQSRILESDHDMAIESLEHLLPPDSRERKDASKMVSDIVSGFEALGHSEKNLAKKIMEILK